MASNSDDRTLLTLLVPPGDKSMLEQLGELMFGESNMSATVRWLIREEAKRQGILPVATIQRQSQPEQIA